MGIQNLQPHKADVYRATEEQNTTVEITGYTKVYSNVPCFIQPATSAEAFYYAQRGLENDHTIYTSTVNNTYQRNDVFTHKGYDYHIVGVKNGLLKNVYIELAAKQYPEGAKRRLDTGAYD